MIESAVTIERRGPAAWIWLDRPEVHNAFDGAMVEELTAAFSGVEHDPAVRVIVLSGRGRSFSAGARIEWMKAQGAASIEENTADGKRLANLFRVIAESPKPTIARVAGAAVGGGVGLVAACDIAIGAANAVFALSEVRLGLIPATIAPYVIRAIGPHQAGRLFLTGDRIDASAAERIGLLHEVVETGLLDDRVDAVITSLLAGAPLAQTAAKKLIDAVSHGPITADLIEATAERIAERRAHPEASEGLSAFLEKRPAAWVPRS